MKEIQKYMNMVYKRVFCADFNEVNISNNSADLHTATVELRIALHVMLK